MVKCCVPGCGAVGKQIFHAFPAKRELREQWIEKTKTFHLTEEQMKSYAKICRYHFRDTDFIINQRNQRGLKPNVVPTLYLPTADTNNTPNLHHSASAKSKKPASFPSTAKIRDKPSIARLDHSYSAKDKQQKVLWKRRHTAETVPPDLHFDVQTLEVTDESFSVESNQIKDREFEKFRIEAEANKRRIFVLEEELRKCKQQSRVAEQKLDMSNKKLKNARAQIKKLKLNKVNVYNYLRTIFNGEQLALINMQLRNAGRKLAGRRYTPEEKSLALILYKLSPKNYRFMRKVFTLPSKRTLGRHSAQLMFGTGVNQQIFELIKEKAKTLSTNGRYCSLSWDEVSLKSHLDFNVTRDEIDGFVDLAMIRKPVFASHALTFMIRGIEIPYKQAIGFFYTDGLKSFELAEMITLMTKAVLDTGLNVIMSVCDQVGTNAKAIRHLINPNLRDSKPLTGLLSYRIGNNDIIHCYDPPHIIKGIRNNLMTKHLKHGIVERWNVDGKCFNSNVKEPRDRLAKWDDIEKLYIWCEGSGILEKITAEHIHPQKLKMKVSVATQVFSQTFGDSMLKHSNAAKMRTHSSDTANILLFFNDVFDSINTSCLSGENELKGPVTENSVHFVFWVYALEMLSSMQWLNKETGTPCNRTSIIQKLRSTILGYMEISKQCLNMNMTNIALRNMNQDGLENFFGNVRSCVHNSNSLIATHFRSAFVTVFMTNSVAHSIKSNCEPDSSKPLLSDIHHLLMKKTGNDSQKPDIENEDFNSTNHITICDFSNVCTVDPDTVDTNIVDQFEHRSYDPIIFEPEFSEKELSDVHESAISNLSKSVFEKLLNISKCDECRATLVASSNFNNEDDFKLASVAFNKNFKKIFCNIDECLEYVCAEKNLKAKVIKSIENVQLEKMGCPDDSFYIEAKFKEFCTIFGILSFCKRVNYILSGKNKIYSENFNSIEQLAYTLNCKKKKIGKYSDIFE